MIAYEVARGGFIDQHVHLIRRVYRERRDIMLTAMGEHFPTNVHWTHPEGGLFLWSTMPEQMDAKDVLRVAVEQKVAFVPGQPFFPAGDGQNTMRLNFSNAKPEQIREGIMRLGHMLTELMEEKVPA